MTGEQLTARQKLLAKIKALLAKTVANGCTEAEAMDALEMAQRMMEEYEVTETDLQFGAEQAQMDKREQDDRDRIREYLATAVGQFCQCEVWRGGHESITFCGLPSDTVFAHWLLDTLADFVKRELGNDLVG